MLKTRWEYRNIYLKSFWWRELRRKVIETSCGNCYCCDTYWQNNEEWLEVHHASYKNINTKKEIDDLICVCSWCHDEIHELNQLYKIPLSEAHEAVRRMRNRLSGRNETPSLSFHGRMKAMSGNNR